MGKSLSDSGSFGKYPGMPTAFSSVAYGRYSATPADFVSKFTALVRRWRYDTMLSSSVEETLAHEAFQQIVDMGEIAVPQIIHELEVSPDLLVAALPLITGRDPVSDDSRGDMRAMATDWIDWYNRG